MDVTAISLDDPKTYQLLSSGETLGVFQVESPGMQKLLRAVKPTSIHDVSAVVALYRPGPMGAGAHLEYARKKASGDRRANIHPELNDALAGILDETYGLLVYQEQVMQIINIMTGWSYAEADDILTAMRKKKHEKLAESRPAFLDAASRRFSVEAGEALWEVLIPFADYSFNKSHSVAYAHITVWTAYLKANHPKEYMASLLSHASEGKADERGPKELYLEECKRLGIKILRPDINESETDFTPTKDGIRYGLGAIKGIGEPAAAAVIARRPYASLNDFFRSADARVLNGGVLDALTKSGTFDSLWPRREELVVEAREIAQMATTARRAEDSGQRAIVTPDYRPSRPTEKDSRLRGEWELEAIGTQLTYPAVILTPSGRLDSNQWEWLRARLTAHLGDQPVSINIGSNALSHPTGVRLTQELVDALKIIGVEVEER